MIALASAGIESDGCAAARDATCAHRHNVCDEGGGSNRFAIPGACCWQFYLTRRLSNDPLGSLPYLLAEVAQFDEVRAHTADFALTPSGRACSV
jgi:hypothetical protein